MAHLTLIRGLPGSGKSTKASAMSAATGSLHFEADQWMMVDGEYQFDPAKLHYAHKQCLQSTKDALLAGKDVVVSNTFTTKKELAPYLKLAEELTVPVNIIICTSDYGSVHNVPDETMTKMRARFDYDIK